MTAQPLHLGKIQSRADGHIPFWDSYGMVRHSRSVLVYGMNEFLLDTTLLQRYQTLLRYAVSRCQFSRQDFNNQYH